MTLVHRQVKKLELDKNKRSEINESCSVSCFRSSHAWVLLGEPGMGKTTLFKSEAESGHGEYISVKHFINETPPNENYRNKTLFLDALDEARSDDPLIQIKNKLKALGYPKFRISCRAADWYGSTDRAALSDIVPNNDFQVLSLEPLRVKEDVPLILRDNFNIEDPEFFITEAEQRGVSELLDNPQTLALLVEAKKSVAGDRWPESRSETYKLACKELVKETNKYYRDKNRLNPTNPKKVLDTAGQLCAILLLSGKTGIALDPDSADEHFPDRNDFSVPDMEIASKALHSNLFRSEGEERFFPTHRSVAEYLASHWIANQIKSGLPVGRVLNLLLNGEDRAISGLRGLYGWLALHCLKTRRRFIESDPLTVMLYGDIRPMSVADKRCLLNGLKQEAKFFLNQLEKIHFFGVLSDAQLANDFKTILCASDRNDDHQAHVYCVLCALLYGEKLSVLVEDVLSLVRDETFWPTVRLYALKVWMRLEQDAKNKIALLEEIQNDLVKDRDDELMGYLLENLYPDHLDPNVLLDYLHAPKAPNLMGTYAFFWKHNLAKTSPDEHLSVLIDTWRSEHPKKAHWLEPALKCPVHDWQLENLSEENKYKQKQAKNRRTRTERFSAYLTAIQAGTAPVLVMYHLACTWSGRYSDIQGETPDERFKNFCENDLEMLKAAETGFMRCPERGDLPTVDKIIDLHIKQQEHYLCLPCLIGMKLRWQNRPEIINNLPEDILRRMIAFALVFPEPIDSDWMIHLAMNRPELATGVFINYAKKVLKNGSAFNNVIFHKLRNNACYKEKLAPVLMPRLLEAFPVKIRLNQLYDLKVFLEDALDYTPELLRQIVEKKLSKKGMDKNQKVFWYATALQLEPGQEYETLLWKHIGQSETLAHHLITFLDNGYHNIHTHYEVSEKTLSMLIEITTPHAELQWTESNPAEWTSGEAFSRGVKIREMITRLASMATVEAEQEVNRLLSVPALHKFKNELEQAHYQLQQRKREKAFKFLSLKEIDQVLTNKAPVNIKDLAELTLGFLEDIEYQIHHDNDDGFRFFWADWNNKKPREENECRDLLLTRLRNCFEPLHVQCDPEADHAGNKRTDIRLSFNNQFELPIEIKHNKSRQLWTGLRDQLINQYTKAPKAKGYGIYLVLFFGKDPNKAQDIKRKLEAQLNDIERKRIFIHVLKLKPKT